jgi:aminobenzoyl-glutamate utilization protein A
MNRSTPIRDRLVAIRREFHRYPEPAWREFYTTARIIEFIDQIGVDECYIGPEALVTDDRMEVPNTDEIQEWLEKTRQNIGNEAILEQLAGGNTGAVAVLENGPGPTVGLRVDIDALPIKEASDAEHRPAAEGFRSEHDGFMHACGHDAHMTIGLGVLEAIRDSDFDGTLKVFFQPAEEVGGGGKPMASSQHLSDVDYLLAVHVGFGHPTGEVVAGFRKPLALSNLAVEFTGRPAHAGKAPQEGNNAAQAMATAIQNLYAIPRHEEGLTRVNVGNVQCDNSSSVIPEAARLEVEVRGETTTLMRYMKQQAEQTLQAAADMHDCTVEIELLHETIRADSDEAVVCIIHDVAQEQSKVDTLRKWTDFGASEDACYLMKAVQDHGGYAAYTIIGTDHPTGHHTSTFDVDEASLAIGVDVLSEAIKRLGAVSP